MAATIRLKRKTFSIGNLGSAIANTWKSGALGKAKIIGGATVAAGGAGALYGGAKFAKGASTALKGEMGDENV